MGEWDAVPDEREECVADNGVEGECVIVPDLEGEENGAIASVDGMESESVEGVGVIAVSPEDEGQLVFDAGVIDVALFVRVDPDGCTKSVVINSGIVGFNVVHQGADAERPGIVEAMVERPISRVGGTIQQPSDIDDAVGTEGGEEHGVVGAPVEAVRGEIDIDSVGKQRGLPEVLTCVSQTVSVADAHSTARDIGNIAGCIGSCDAVDTFLYRDACIGIFLGGRYYVKRGCNIITIEANVRSIGGAANNKGIMLNNVLGGDDGESTMVHALLHRSYGDHGGISVSVGIQTGIV